MFPTEQDSATFWDKGTEVPLLSQDKGTTGQAKNLAKGRDRPVQPKSGMGQRDTGTRIFFCPGTKGQRDKLKILPRDGTGRDSQNSGRDGPE